MSLVSPLPPPAPTTSLPPLACASFASCLPRPLASDFSAPVPRAPHPSPAPASHLIAHHCPPPTAHRPLPPWRQAADADDAYEWIVAIASCLYFSSSTFERLLHDCQRFFNAAPKAIADRLSPIEALDTLRQMGRQVTIGQVQDAAALVCPDGASFGPREFTYLVRNACGSADMYSELVRAFGVLDPDNNGEVTLQEMATALRKVRHARQPREAWCGPAAIRAPI